MFPNPLKLDVASSMVVTGEVERGSKDQFLATDLLVYFLIYSKHRSYCLFAKDVFTFYLEQNDIDRANSGDTGSCCP